MRSKTSCSPSIIPSGAERYDVSHPDRGDCLSFKPSGNTVYDSPQPTDVLDHVHPASAVGQSVPMAAGLDSQTAPLTASITDVLDRLETLAETIEDHLRNDVSERIHEYVVVWGEKRDTDRPFEIAARYGALNLLLKATLWEWYSHRGTLSILHGDPRNKFDAAADVTENDAFQDSQLDEFIRRVSPDIAAELSWWRYAVLTSEEPPDDIGYLFETLIPAAERRTHGQFRTPRRISQIMRELAVCGSDQVLDAGMGSGALSVLRNQSRSVSTFGVEQDRLGFLMSVTALATADQPGVVHEADFFDIGEHPLGMDPDAAIRMGPDIEDVDIIPGKVDAAIGNPPYVANRNLSKPTSHYRRHLAAFGGPNETPYLDGEKKLSGRSDLFVYFVTHATQFLAEGGRLVYLLPTKWMETQYGETLQTFLLDHYRLSAVIEFDDTVFDDAEVDAVIVVAERCVDATTRQNTTTQFITVNSEPAPTIIHDLVTEDVETVAVDSDTTHSASPSDPDYQVTTVSQSDLTARDTLDGPLTQYFKTPDALHSLKSNDQFVSLDTLASVTYGQKTGNNEIFLLDSDDLDTWPIAERFYTRALDDFGDTTGYRLTTCDSDTHMLDIHSYVESVGDSGVLREYDTSRTQQVKTALTRDGYITLLEYLDQCKAIRTDAATRDNVWFDLGPLDVPDIVHPYRIHREVRVSRNVADLVPTNCANNLDVRSGVDVTVLLGYLNSTVHAAFVELWGQTEGGGSLEAMTGTLKDLPVADVQSFGEEANAAVKTAYQALVRGENNAQTRLDAAVLAALDADIDVATLQEARESLVHERLSTS